jgi:hypothetical protein
MNSAYLTVFSAMMRELAGVSVNRPQSHRLAVSGDNMSEELDFNKALGLGSKRSRLWSSRFPLQQPQRSQNHSLAYQLQAQKGQTSTRREQHIGCEINFASGFVETLIS